MTTHRMPHKRFVYSDEDARAVFGSLLPKPRKLEDISDQIDRILAKFNSNHDERGRFGEGGGATTLRDRVAAARNWVKGKSAREVIAAAAASHGLRETAKEALSVAVQGLINHGTGLDASTWHLSEAAVDHTIREFSTIAKMSALQGKQAVSSAIGGLIAARQKQVAARMGKQTHHLDQLPMHGDAVLDILMRVQDAVDKAVIADEPAKGCLDMTTMKSKDFAFKVKLNETDPAGTIEGYVSAYGVKDLGNEIVISGAFTKSLERQKREGAYPLMLWQHDTSEPIGVWDDLVDDGNGLWGKGRLLINANVPTADKVYSLVRHDAVRGMSIGYKEIKVEPGKDGDPTKLIELDLMEASIVSFPMNRQAGIENVKSEDENKAIKLWKGFEHLARCFRDGEPLPVKQFEEFLREAGFPKSVAVQIASVGYAKSIRSESEGNEATSEAIARLRAAVRAISPKS